MSKGANSDLKVTDLYDVLPGDHSEELGLRLQRLDHYITISVKIFF